MRVAVVTDSASCLPADLAKQWEITVIPMQIRIGGRLDDEVRVPRQDLLAALRAEKPVSTEPPDPAAFYWAYQDAAASGADAVVSAHVSSLQSKTFEHARAGAEQARIPVRVVDSATFGMSLGYAVAGAARVASAGGGPARVLDALHRRLDGSSALIYVETLEYLRRGGRIGTAASLIGTALSLKPLLTVAHGQIAPLDRVLGAARGLRKLVDTAVSRADGRSVDIAVEHVGVPEQARAVLDALAPRIPGFRGGVITEAGSAVAVHLGPGTVSVTISPA
ncbi:DegV family protein [Actinokineospora iranica]|uniref:EDD domain protein, DegV family n=1 Tax=Actinokineospora iranica TaxID=1271860 RepID=A0A1G6N1S2_9PSEU|nr:DegV family protein [Actinokineospora iranica]SDC61778.1 EDD domain protein, DegV family [Actinokineospora iranica]